MKKLLSMLLVYTIISSCMIVGALDYGQEYENMPKKSYAQKFSDVPKSHWAFSYIGEMYERGVINGYPNGKFMPDESVERAEFAKIMVNAAGIKVVNNYTTSFVDVGIYDWYAPYIECAKEYLTGYYSSYRPETDALREDIAVALVKLKGYDISVADESILDMFDDVYSISKDLRKYIAVAVERGLVSGYEDDTFRGQDTITRAEATAMLWRAFQYGNDNKSVVADTEEKIDIETDIDVEDKKDNNLVSEKESSDTTIYEDKEDEKVEEEEKLPYVIKKLTTAQLGAESWHHMTMDNNKNIYFLDADNCVYKLDVSKRSKSKLFDTKKLSLEKIEEQETEVVTQITETVETGEYEEIVEEVEETIIDEETGEETIVITEVTKQIPIMEEVTKEVTTTKTEKIIVAEYNDYVPVQIFYDDVNDRLMLSGYYKSIVEAYKTPITDGHYNVIYDITNGKKEVLSEGAYLNRQYGNIYFIATLNDSVYRVGEFTSIEELESAYGREYEFNIETGNSVGGKYNTRNEFAFKCGGELYTISGFGDVMEYNFTNGSFEKLGNLRVNRYSSKGDCFYFCESDGSMYKVSVKTGKTTVLDINFNKNVEFADLGGIKNIYQRFFVIEDSTFVFYDTNMNAFRILTKNN